MALLYPALGSAIALAGGDKLYGQRGYRGMFRQLGWSKRDMEMVAAAELVGGFLMIPRVTRRVGGALVAAVSAVILTSEVKHDDEKLAAMRALVLITGLMAMVSPGD